MRYICAPNEAPDSFLFRDKPKMNLDRCLAGSEHIPFGARCYHYDVKRRVEHRSSFGRVSFAIQATTREAQYAAIIYKIYSLVIVFGESKFRFHFRKIKS